ncbi:MAG: hypothetical protein NC293_03965 [Roseburia sp.]|nr:hypothetical protein [Roseburia sp.]
MLKIIFGIDKKKELSKLFLIGVSIMGMAFYVTGCSNEGIDSDNVSMIDNKMNESQVANEQDTDYQKEATNVKVSNLFNDSERRIWFYLHEFAYDEHISAIYVIEENSVRTYKFYNGDGTAQWQPTLEELDGKSDEEIVDFIEKKKKAVGESIEFTYSRDSTGNKIKEETIHIGDGTLSLNFEIENILKVETILSNRFLGFESNEGTYLISKYDFGKDTNIILNEIGDEGVVEFN